MKKRLIAWMAIIVVISLVVGIGFATAQSASKRKPYHIEIRGARFGGTAYIMAFAASDILNKKSSWVRASALEAVGGGVENIKVVGSDKKKKARSILMCDADMFSFARIGKPPFDKKPELYKDLMVVREEGIAIHLYLTLDPNIKNITDLKGKRFATWPKGTLKHMIHVHAVGGAGEEVLNTIKWQHAAYGGFDDLLLGKVDVVFGFANDVGTGYALTPAVKELIMKAKGQGREVYVIGFTPEQRARSAELYGENWGVSAMLAPDSLGPGFPPKDIITTTTALCWAAYPEMPEDVVYEIVKILDENSKMFLDYHPTGGGLRSDYAGLFPQPKNLWHPGAKRYFEEKNIPYGVEYWREKRGK